MQNKAIQLFLDKTSYTKKQIKKVIKLKDGFTNYSYKFITSDNQIFQVRISNNSHINRSVEKIVFDNLKIVPIYFDPKTGNMIRQWVYGKKIKKWDYQKIVTLIEKLKKFHSMPKNNIPKFNAYAYVELLKNNSFDNNLYTKYIELTNKYPNDYNTPCHCDLNPANIIYDKNTCSINIIDYELTRMNSVYFELANLARESMNKKQIIFLANKYGNIDLNKLKDYLIITSIYAYQWSLSVKDNSKIRRYRKHVLKRLKYLESLDLNDKDDVLAKILNKPTLHNINQIKSNEDESFIDIVADNKTSCLKYSDNKKKNEFDDEHRKHNLSCKIKGKKKSHKDDNPFDMEDEEFKENELRIQEKIVKSLDGESA